MRQLLLAAGTLALTACASTPGVYSAPKSSSAHAVISINNQIEVNDDASDSGWTMPGMETENRYETMLFQIDGNKITEVGGVQKVRVAPGQHQVQVMVDNGLIPLSGDVKGNFVEAHQYAIRVSLDKQDDNRYQATLVDEAAANKVMDQVRF